MIDADDSHVVHVHRDVLTAAELVACAEISGEANDPPLGIAFVIALRSVIASGLLPGGAMMLGHRATWHEPLGPGPVVTEMSFAEADPPRTRFQRVVIAYRTRRDGRLVLEQRQEVLWPTIA